MDIRSPITVAVARFEDLVSRGLRAMIEEDSNLKIVARDVGHAKLDAVLADHAPQVAILNFGSLRTPLEINELSRAHPATRLVVLANRPSPSECNQLLAFGASACLSKETQARDVLSALHLASRGLQVLPGTLGGSSEPERIGPDLLTPREADVLELLQRGKSNAEIAGALTVGVETVRTHARAVYRKLGVSTRRELVELARQA